MTWSVVAKGELYSRLHRAVYDATYEVCRCTRRAGRSAPAKASHQPERQCNVAAMSQGCSVGDSPAGRSPGVPAMRDDRSGADPPPLA